MSKIFLRFINKAYISQTIELNSDAINVVDKLIKILTNKDAILGDLHAQFVPFRLDFQIRHCGVKILPIVAAVVFAVGGECLIRLTIRFHVLDNSVSHEILNGLAEDDNM